MQRVQRGLELSTVMCVRLIIDLRDGSPSVRASAVAFLEGE
jgi:hypothetical protein